MDFFKSLNPEILIIKTTLLFPCEQLTMKPNFFKDKAFSSSPHNKYSVRKHFFHIGL